jgi:anti-anti-sigma factor
VTDIQPDVFSHTDIAVRALPAEVDIANAQRLGQELAALLAPHVKVLIADMTGTTFCDSSGVHMLVRTQREAIAAGAALRIVAPCGVVLRVFQIMGVDRFFPVYPDLGTAVAGRCPHHR